jgi:DNA-binding NtrC family response regulator
VRIIAATNKDLRTAVQAGQFREDLFYRINVFPIALPPLRERREDIPALAQHFLNSLRVDMGKPVEGFSPAAIKAMSDYGWPGNVRELQNCIERAVILAKSGMIDENNLPRYISDRPPATTSGPHFPIILDEELERIERDYILAALTQSGGVQVSAASLLGVNERSLWHRIKKLGIQITKRVVGERAGIDPPAD